MDSPSINHVSLCSGYGGIDLGLRRCISNLRTVAYAEIEAFACELLLARMEGGQLDAAPIWSDIKSFPWRKFSGLVDILSGGYPCQPFSSAGRRRGQEDPRHLWPFIADGIRLLRPRVCFFENVEGHITLGLRDVLHDMAGMGYRTTWGLFSAAECGAPHSRKRVFILAHAGCCSGGQSHHQMEERKGTAEWINGSSFRWPSRPNESQFAWEPPRVVANAASRLSRIKAEWKRRQNLGGGGPEIMGDTRSQKPSGLPQPEERDKSAEARITGSSVADSINARMQRRTSSTAGDSGSGSDYQTKVSSRECEDRIAEQSTSECTLGRDADGPTSRMDYAQLCISGDYRIDELRLLGNGVVPATAELAYRTLSRELSL